MARYLSFLHNVVHGHVDSVLSSSMQFQVPARISRYSCIFYPSMKAKLSPLVRMQNCLNNLSPHVNIFSDLFVSKEELELHLFGS